LEAVRLTCKEQWLTFSNWWGRCSMLITCFAAVAFASASSCSISILTQFLGKEKIVQCIFGMLIFDTFIYLTKLHQMWTW
jgi:hypothetical protein